jgi:hypothetical protein
MRQTERTLLSKDILLHETKQEKCESPAQLLNRLIKISASTIRKVSTSVECAIWPKRLDTDFTPGSVERGLIFRAPESFEYALRIATTVYSALQFEQNSRKEDNFRLE